VLQVSLHLVRRDVFDIAATLVQHRHLAVVDVEPQGPEAFVDEALTRGRPTKPRPTTATTALLYLILRIKFEAHGFIGFCPRGK